MHGKQIEFKMMDSKNVCLNVKKSWTWTFEIVVFIFQNPQCDLQAQDRCHRIGQTKPVVVYRLVTANTIDQKIIERAAAKRKLEKMVVHKGMVVSAELETVQ